MPPPSPKGRQFFSDSEEEETFLQAVWSIAVSRGAMSCLLFSPFCFQIVPRALADNRLTPPLVQHQQKSGNCPSPLLLLCIPLDLVKMYFFPLFRL